jgi:protein SCO1/2
VMPETGNALSWRFRRIFKGPLRRWCRRVALGFILLASAASGMAASAEALPRIGPAPEFRLTDQNGKAFTLKQLRGRVAVVTFIFTSCSDSCPLLTAKLVKIHGMLGADRSEVFFVGITVDPLHDSPAVLKRYAELYSAGTST